MGWLNNSLLVSGFISLGLLLFFFVSEIFDRSGALVLKIIFAFMTVSCFIAYFISIFYRVSIDEEGVSVKHPFKGTIKFDWDETEIEVVRILFKGVYLSNFHTGLVEKSFTRPTFHNGDKKFAYFVFSKKIMKIFRSIIRKRSSFIIEQAYGLL